GAAARITVGGKQIGLMGVVGDEEVKKHDLVVAPAVLEVDFGFITALPRKRKSYTELPRFPGVRRDIAIVVPDEVLWSRIETLVRESAEMMKEISFESIYRGKGVDGGKKSVAFSMLFRAEGRSLTDDEANAMRDNVVACLTSAIEGSALR
ncbi:MAG: hypothetical protein JXR97_11630, partial [Planctomycetes bacterium]|nr:hypothetical protein [Planctomycetota bacterium]